MILKRMGELLYPRLQPSQRRREMKTLLLAVLTTLAFAAGMVALMISRNSTGR